jgi:hypothetical protein
VVAENSVRSENTGVLIIREIMVATTMSSLFIAFFALLASSFRTRAALQAEILALRHQLAVFQKNAPRRLRLHRGDRSGTHLALGKDARSSGRWNRRNGGPW